MKLTCYHPKFFAHEISKHCSSDSLDITVSLIDTQDDLNPPQNAAFSHFDHTLIECDVADDLML